MCNVASYVTAGMTCRRREFAELTRLGLSQPVTVCRLRVDSQTPKTRAHQSASIPDDRRMLVVRHDEQRVVLVGRAGDGRRALCRLCDKPVRFLQQPRLRRK